MKPERNITLELVNCVICKKEFYRNRVRSHSKGARTRSFRPVGCMTCSKKCSRKYLPMVYKESAKRRRLKLKIQKRDRLTVGQMPHEHQKASSTLPLAIPTYCKGCSFKCQATECECTCHDRMREYYSRRKAK